jgi:hypothetical protein
MTSIFTVLNYPAIILFDSGASHSFISAKFSAKCQLPFHHTNGGVLQSQHQEAGLPPTKSTRMCL